MGFIFQKANFLKNLSIADNIVFPAFQLGKQSRDEIRKTAEEMMERLGIAHVGGHDIRQVSGGHILSSSAPDPAVCFLHIFQEIKRLLSDRPPWKICRKQTAGSGAEDERMA